MGYDFEIRECLAEHLPATGPRGRRPCEGYSSSSSSSSQSPSSRRDAPPLVDEAAVFFDVPVEPEPQCEHENQQGYPPRRLDLVDKDDRERDCDDERDPPVIHPKKPPKPRENPLDTLDCLRCRGRAIVRFLSRSSAKPSSAICHLWDATLKRHPSAAGGWAGTNHTWQGGSSGGRRPGPLSVSWSYRRSSRATCHRPSPGRTAR